MEPQTTPTPDGNIVIGGAPQPDSRMPVTGGNGGSKKKWMLLAAVLVIAIAVVGVVLATHHKATTKPDQKQQQTTFGPTKPSYGNIKVGDFRYVNACRALPATDEQNLFAGISQTALFSAISAENTLPTSAINEGQGKVMSSCSRSFGSDTPYADTVVTFQIDQYPTVQAAQKDFDAFGVTQAELDQANQRFGTNLTNETAPLPGVKDTIYDPKGDTSYTLDGNKIISFSALLAGVTPQQFQQAIIGALPTVLANVSNDKLSQDLGQDPVFGKKIGDSTYLNPCAFFTDKDFKAMTGAPNDPTNVRFSYTYAATTYLNDDISSGEANDTCTRYTYPGVKTNENIRTEIQYFKTAAEANQTIQQNFTRRSSEADEKMQQVPGVGAYAYSRQTGNLSYFDVQKGPYILEFMITRPSGSTPTVAEYTKAANVLLPKLR